MPFGFGKSKGLKLTRSYISQVKTKTNTYFVRSVLVFLYFTQAVFVFEFNLESDLFKLKLSMQIIRGHVLGI